MKKIFWIGALGLLLTEIAQVYFIMPLPGSQDMNSIGIAYTLHSWRWLIRILFTVLLLGGLFWGNWKKKWIPVIGLLLVGAVAYMSNFKMAADHMFYQPNSVLMQPVMPQQSDSNFLVLGITYAGEARAYPIRYLGYHHQVKDSIGGKPVLITYCTVCRTGRVYEPLIKGKAAAFRLVGMDHFNAMLEDENTGSWWRQVNGEAIAGPLKGERLPEFFSWQTSLAQWLRYHPQTLLMQEDPAFRDQYDSSGNYESGRSRSSLTGTDSLSWKPKSWVIGIKHGSNRRAYDWNQLKQERLILDKIGSTPIALVLASDNNSFFALERTADSMVLQLRHDTLFHQNNAYLLNGSPLNNQPALKPIAAYQEFWHSWQQFNPGSSRY